MSLMFVGARSLPMGCPRFAGEHGPRTASVWQAGSELAWLVPQFIFVLHLARCSGMNVWPLGSACWSPGAFFTSVVNLDSSYAGLTRCDSRFLPHARSRRVSFRCAGEHGPRTASDWQAGSELAWLVPQFIFVLHLARCSGMNVWPCGSAWWRIYICADFDSSCAGVSTVGVTRFFWRTLAPDGLPEVCRGARTQNSIRLAGWQ